MDRQMAPVPPSRASTGSRTPCMLFGWRGVEARRRTVASLGGVERLAPVEVVDGPALGAGGVALRRMGVRCGRRDERHDGGCLQMQTLARYARNVHIHNTWSG